MSEENRNEDTKVTPEGEQPVVESVSVENAAPAATDAAPEHDVVATAETSAPVEVDVKTEEAAVAASAGGAALAAKLLPKKWYVTAAAVVAVALVLAGVVYMMEQQGRLNTGLFDGVNRMVAMNKAVATVNDVKISQYDLDISMSQISSGAALQGIDIADPEIKAKIQEQAIEMLVNTELLKQEAAARNIVVTDEDVNTRLETLKSDVGGEEVLAQRMEEFNIDHKTLLRDIRSELIIQALLTQVFEEKEAEVTDKDVEDFYNAAGGAAAGLPPLDSVREQIEAQVRTTKEQEVVSGFVAELKEKATVEMLI